MKKGTLRRMETEGLHVQVGAGKKKQILDKYVPTELNHVNGAEKAKEHAKICTGYLDQVVAEFKTEMDKLTGLTRALTDYVPRRFKVVSSAQCDLDVMFQPQLPRHIRRPRRLPVDAVAQPVPRRARRPARPLHERRVGRQVARTLRDDAWPRRAR